ncbi:MAG: M48 family metalloprotease [Theionarchaea archaeon]|nr:M48 family metalloprotease [Theionarchaea archaeon]
MYVWLGTIILLIALEIAYFRAGRRNKVIDQFESDIRILLLIVVIVGSYILFLSISLYHITSFIGSGELKYLACSLYFLSPPLLGVLLYLFLPQIYGRSIVSKDVPAPDVPPTDTVPTLSRLLGLETIPHIKKCSSTSSPAMYGRNARGSVLILGDMHFLTEEEQKAVIVHELSHINQGDIGFYTWLTLLLKAFSFWMLLYPAAVYFRYRVPPLFAIETSGFVVFIPVLFVLLFLLKNSLFRIRESIADAYAVLHGMGDPLERALIKYSTLETSKKRGFSLHFYSGVTSSSVMAGHPPLLNRLHNIKARTYLTEASTNLSTEAALWTGIAAAFFYHCMVRSFIYIHTGVVDSLPSDTLSHMMWLVLFLSIVNVVGASYAVPASKASMLFMDLGHGDFVVPLLRNMGITLAAAVVTGYVLSLSTQFTSQIISGVVGGFLFWVLGFVGARRTDFSHGDTYLVLAPLSQALIFWYPLKKIYSLAGMQLDAQFYFSLLAILVLSLTVVLILTVKGMLLMERNDRILMLFKKTKEFPGTNDLIFIILVVLTLLVPGVVAFGTYMISFLVDGLNIFPFRNIPMYSIIAVLGIYGLKNADILFFSKLAFLVDILSGKGIDDTDRRFIGHVIEKYQSPDGGFDYAGIGFSNQKDTYYFARTAEILNLPLDIRKIERWIKSTETHTGGVALFAGGNPRIEGLYYALLTSNVLHPDESLEKEMHKKWVISHFNGHCFDFEYDTAPRFLQTCWGAQVLYLLGGTTEIDTNGLAQWIIAQFNRNSTPREAFFAACTLKSLKASRDPAQQWLSANTSVLHTRVDKNLEDIYYYIKVMRAGGEAPPPLVLEQALRDLVKTRKEYSNSGS